MEKNASHSPCVSPAATTTTSLSAGESSWALDIANFMAYPHNGDQEMSQELVSGSSGSGSLFSGFSSSFASYGDGDDASFITSELMCDDNDDSLQDTACSSAAVSKVTTTNTADMKSMATMKAKEISIPQLDKYFVDASSRQPADDVVQEVACVDTDNDKALYECIDQ
ncbi:hypothetical protein ABZP36_007029 [Zizania latifolia]